MSERKLGVLLSYANIAVSMVVNLLYTPIMLRLLGQGEYGVYSLALSVIGYLSLLYAGINSLYLRYASRYRHDSDADSEARLNGLFVVLFSILAVVALALGVTMASFVDVFFTALTADELALAHTLFIIMAVNMAFSMLNSVFYTIVYSREHFVVVKGVDILRAGVVPALTLPLLYLGYGSVAMSLTLLAGTVLSLILTGYYSIRRMGVRFSFRGIPFRLLPEMLGFSIFIILQGIMDQFNWQLAKFLLGSVVSSQAIAIYTVGLQIALVFISFAGAFVGIVAPRIYELVAAGDDAGLNALWRRIGRYSFYIVYYVLVAFAFMGRDFIELWAGPGYSQSYYIALLLMVPMSVHLCQMMAVEVLRARSIHGHWTIVHLAFSAVGFMLCIPATLAYGVIGVAVGTCVTTFIVLNVYDNYYYHTAAGLDVLEFFRELWRLRRGIIASALLALALGQLHLATWGSFAATAILFTLLYAPIMYALAMNDAERALVRRGLMRLKKQ